MGCRSSNEQILLTTLKVTLRATTKLLGCDSDIIVTREAKEASSKRFNVKLHISVLLETFIIIAWTKTTFRNLFWLFRVPARHSHCPPFPWMSTIWASTKTTSELNERKFINKPTERSQSSNIVCRCSGTIEYYLISVVFRGGLWVWGRGKIRDRRVENSKKVNFLRAFHQDLITFPTQRQSTAPTNKPPERVPSLLSPSLC